MHETDLYEELNFLKKFLQESLVLDILNFIFQNSLSEIYPNFDTVYAILLIALVTVM